MISSRQIFSCTVLSVSSVFVSVAWAFSLCRKAWSIFQENVIPVPGLFTRSRRHQRSETSSPQCSRYKSACIRARQHRCEYRGDIWYEGQANASTNTAGSTNCSLRTPNYPSAWSRTHAQIPSLNMHIYPAGDFPAAIWPLKWVCSPWKHATCCPDPPQSVTCKK